MKIVTEFEGSTHKLYLEYLNNFITVDGFASYYGIRLNHAYMIIELGRAIHNDAFLDK